MKIVVAVFLILHGLVHGILAMVPSPNADEPVFATFFSNSWLLSRLGFSESAGKLLAFVLAAGFPGALRLVAYAGSCFGRHFVVAIGHLLAHVCDRWRLNRCGDFDRCTIHRLDAGVGEQDARDPCPRGIT